MIAHARQGSPCGHDHRVPPDPYVLQQSPAVVHIRSAAHEPFDLSRDFCRRVILGVLCQWRAQACRQAIRRSTAHSRRNDYQEWEELLAGHMRHAIASNDRAALWKYARIIAGKRIGPHGLVYSAYPTVVPGLRDWTIFLARPGCEGGLGARQ
eukprot:14172448-Heterocapsa_arctica.AAC.1